MKVSGIIWPLNGRFTFIRKGCILDSGGEIPFLYKVACALNTGGYNGESVGVCCLMKKEFDFSQRREAEILLPSGPNQFTYLLRTRRRQISSGLFQKEEG